MELGRPQGGPPPTGGQTGERWFGGHTVGRFESWLGKRESAED